MEATVIKIGTSLGLKVPETVVRNFNLKAGTIVEMNFVHDGKVALRKKQQVREGWDLAFAQYSIDGEDKLMLPDFFDSEIDALL
jgi:antitoxin component of MazEF toxin-antitoxin module